MTQRKSQSYRFLEHTTDAYIEAWAPTLEGAFSHAAEGLYETMLNPEKVEPKLEETVVVEGHDEMELLYNWLEALLLKFEVDEMAYSRFSVDRISKEATQFKLEARIRGEKYIQGKHGNKTEVKGITYHLMQIEKKGGQITLRFLLDL